MGIPLDMFYDETSRDLLCSWCGEVPIDAMMLKQCDHFFCKDCLDELVSLQEHDSRCPVDGFLFDECSVRKPFPFFLKLINNLRMRCKFGPECEEVILYEDAQKHELECDFNPLNNIICDNCFCRLTFATEATHDCISYYKSKISELENEKVSLTEELKSLQAQTVENGTNLSLMPIMKSESVQNIASSSVCFDRDLPVSSGIRALNGSFSLTRETCLRKFKYMIESIKSLRMPVDYGTTWTESLFLKSFLQLVEPRPETTDLYTQIDLSKFFYTGNTLKKFTIERFKKNSIFFQHLLLFDLLEPSINGDSRVLILDYIDHGITQWMALKARLVHTAVNIGFFDNHRNCNKTLPASLRKKISYMPYKKELIRLIHVISVNHQTYDLIIDFAIHSDEQVKKLMTKFSPKGIYIAFHREPFALKIYSWASGTSKSSNLNVDLLLNDKDTDF